MMVSRSIDGLEKLEGQLRVYILYCIVLYCRDR